MSRGRAIILLARVALVLALVVAGLGWWQLGRLADNIDTAVGVAAETSANAAQTVAVSAQLAREVRDLASTVEASLGKVDRVLAAAGQAGGSVQTSLGKDLPDAIEGLSSTADRLAKAGATVARVISILPGNQNTAFADELAKLAEGLRPLAGTVRGLAGPLGDAVTALGPLRSDVDAARAQLAGIDASMRELAVRLDRLAKDADEASTRLGESAGRGTTRLFWWRVLLVLGLLVVVAFAVGLELLGRDVESRAALHDAAVSS